MFRFCLLICQLPTACCQLLLALLRHYAPLPQDCNDVLVDDAVHKEHGQPYSTILFRMSNSAITTKILNPRSSPALRDGILMGSKLEGQQSPTRLLLPYQILFLLQRIPEPMLFQLRLVQSNPIQLQIQNTT